MLLLPMLFLLVVTVMPLLPVHSLEEVLQLPEHSLEEALQLPHSLGEVLELQVLLPRFEEVPSSYLVLLQLVVAALQLQRQRQHREIVPSFFVVEEKAVML